jgi:hypothetical protein
MNKSIINHITRSSSFSLLQYYFIISTRSLSPRSLILGHVGGLLHVLGPTVTKLAHRSPLAPTPSSSSPSARPFPQTPPSSISLFALAPRRTERGSPPYPRPNATVVGCCIYFCSVSVLRLRLCLLAPAPSEFKRSRSSFVGLPSSTTR